MSERAVILVDADAEYYGSVRRQSLQIRVVALAFLTALLDGLDLQIIAYTAPAMVKDVSLGEAALGLIFSGGFAGLAAGSMFLAPLGDRWGRRTIIIFSLLLFGACVSLTPLAQNAEQILVLRALTGVGLGGVMPNAIAISMEFSPPRLRPAMVSMTYFGFIIGAAVGGFAAASLIPHLGWRGLLYVVGALPLLLAIGEYFFLPESPEYLASRNKRISSKRANRDVTAHGNQHQPSPMRAIFSTENRRNSTLMWIAMFANISTATAVFQWLPTILNRTGFALEGANALVALMWASAIPGLLLLISLTRWTSLQKVLGSFLCAGSLATFGLGASIALSASEAVWLLMIGFGVTIAGAQAGFYSLLASVYPESSRVTGIGWAQGVGRIGAIIGPWAIGILLSAGTSILTLFFYLAVPVLVSAIAVWNVRSPRSST